MSLPRDPTGLGVRIVHSSTGYAGCGRYAVDEFTSLFCGRGRGRDGGSGASNLMDGGMERR